MKFLRQHFTMPFAWKKDQLEPSPMAAQRLFIMFWNLAMYLHFAEEWNRPWHCLVAIVFCILGWALRSLVIAWRVSTCAGLIFCWYQFPIQANHMNYLTLANTGLFFASFIVPLKDTRFYLRLTMLSLAAVYFWAGVHKLNSDFFTPTVSCATNMLGRFTKRYFSHVLDTKMIQTNFLAICAVIVEIAIAILLTSKRTWAFAIILCIGLHALLVPIGFVDFASVSLALIALALVSEDFFSLESKRLFMHFAHLYFWAQLFAGIVTGLARLGFSNSISYFLQVLFWELFAIFILYVLFQTAKIRKSLVLPIAAPLKLTWAQKIALSAPALLLFVFGGQNYLGLSTAGTFSMFSNLRTEGASWNHLLIPRSAKIFDFQDRLYFVKSVSRNFRRMNHGHPSANYAMPEFEVFRLLRQWEKKGVRPADFKLIPLFEQSQMFQVYENNYFANDPFSDLQRKFLYFRKIQKPEEANRCRW